MPDPCIFCDSTAATLVYRSKDGIVIVDDPVRPGHVLVGSRTHRENLQDLSPDDAAALMRLANQVAQSVVSLTHAAKVYVAAIGDKDKHFHVHLLPKMPGDSNLGPYIFGPAGWVSSFSNPLDATEVQKVNDALRTALSR